MTSQTQKKSLTSLSGVTFAKITHGKNSNDYLTNVPDQRPELKSTYNEAGRKDIKRGSPISIRFFTTPYRVTSEDLIKKAKDKDPGRLSTQIYAAIMACLCGVIFGNTLAWTSPFLDEDKPRKCTENEICNYDWIPVMVPSGAVIGAISCHILVTKFGPRKTLLIEGTFYIIFYVLLTVYSSFSYDLALRFFSGLFGIAYLICGEILLLDTVHKSLCAKMYIFFKSSIFLGVSVVTVLGLVMDIQTLSIYCIVTPCIHYVMLIIARDSPTYLSWKGEKHAVGSLQWYRGKKDIQVALTDIHRNRELDRLEQDTYQYMLYSKVVFKGLVISLMMSFFQIFTGFYIILTFNFKKLFFERNVFDEIHQTAFTVCIGIMFYVSSLFWTYLHVKFELPVRKTLLYSCWCSSLCLLILGLLLLFSSSEFYLDYGYWFVIVIAMLLIFSVDIGLNYIPEVLSLEYMPVQVRKRAALIHITFHWFFVFLLIVFHLTIKQAFGQDVYFLITSAITFVGGFCCYFFVVETKDRSLITIQIALGGNPIGQRGTGSKRLLLNPKQRTFPHIDAESDVPRIISEQVVTYGPI